MLDLLLDVEKQVQHTNNYVHRGPQYRNQLNSYVPGSGITHASTKLSRSPVVTIGMKPSPSNSVGLFTPQEWLLFPRERWKIGWGSQRGIFLQAHGAERTRTERAESSNSFSSSSTPEFDSGGSGFQVLETRFKQSRTTWILGRACASTIQHEPSIFHKSSVNHVPFTPSGLPGRSPLGTFRVTT